MEVRRQETASIEYQAKILSFARTITRSARRKKTVYKIANLSCVQGSHAPLRERKPPAKSQDSADGNPSSIHYLQLEESLKQKLLVFAISKSCGSRKASSFHSALFSAGTSEASRITVSVHISFSAVLLIYLSERPADTLTAPNSRRDTRKRNTQNVIFLRYLTE